MERLPAAARTRLINICGRLASDFDGERAAAALLASKLLHNFGLGWAEVLAPATVRPRPPSWRDQVDGALARSHCISSWEKDFLRGISRQQSISEKQRFILDGISAKVGAAP